jgi:hypothetical protein
LGLAQFFLNLPRTTSRSLFLVLDSNILPNVACKRALHLYLSKSMFDAGRHGNRSKLELIYRAQLMKFTQLFPNFVKDYTTCIGERLADAIFDA